MRFLLLTCTSCACSVMSDSLRTHWWTAAQQAHIHGVFQARIWKWVAISFSRFPYLGQGLKFKTSLMKEIYLLSVCYPYCLPFAIIQNKHQLFTVNILQVLRLRGRVWLLGRKWHGGLRAILNLCYPGGQPMATCSCWTLEMWLAWTQMPCNSVSETCC